MRLLLILFFIIASVCICSSNILFSKIPYVTTNYTNEYYSLQHISDDNDNTLFSSGIINPQTNYSIIFELDDIYYLTNFIIKWFFIPFSYEILISDVNTSYNKILYVKNDDSDNYYMGGSNMMEDFEMEINDCAKYLQINIINNNMVLGNHIIIRYVDADGYNIKKVVENIIPNNIPINSKPDFDIIKHRDDFDVYFSYFKECNETVYDFNKNGTYYVCYGGYKQEPEVNVYGLYNITPSIIHISSFIKLNITYSLAVESCIGLGINNCDNIMELKSVTNVYGSSIDFYDQYGNVGMYHVCLGINNLWGDTRFKLELVRPIVNSISGCVDEGIYTKNCNTLGGNIMSISGKYFFDYGIIIVKYDNFFQYNNTIVNSTYIQSVLPEGYGNNLSIQVMFEVESDKKNLLSYAKPEVYSVYGCVDDGIETTKCNNNNKSIINIIGNNFGKELSTVLVGSEMCIDVKHNSHSNISCVIEGNRGINNVVYVIQHRGDISVGKNLLSYKQCDIGFELINNECIMCKNGFFKNIEGDISCNRCLDGFYSDVSGISECKDCQENSYSNYLRNGCLCKEGYYMDINNNCVMCDNKDFYGDDIYICDETGLTVENLQNQDGFWRSHKLSTTFYKCKQEEYCPKNYIINDTVICYENHVGMLCDFCKDGFAKDNKGICQMCNQKNGRTYTIIVFCIISYIVLICTSLIYGNSTINILLNDNLDLNLEEEEEEEEDEDEEEEDEEDLLGGLMGLQQKLKIVLSYVQISTILSVNLNIKWPEFMSRVVGSFKALNMDLFDFVGLDYRCSTEFDYYNIFVFQIFMIPILYVLTILGYVLVKMWGRYKKKGEEFFEVVHNRMVYILVLVVFVMYPGVSNSILKLYKCEEIEGNWYLSSDLSIKCYDKFWETYAIIGGIFIFIHILGIPLLFFNILRYYKNKGELSSDLISYRYGFMYMGYRDDMWWFEILELMRKTLLSASIIYLEETPTRIVISMYICLMYLLYITYKKPLKDVNDSFLSILSGTELVLILYCGLILEMKIDKQDKYDEIGFNIFLFIVYTSVIIIGSYQLVIGLAKNNFFHILYENIKTLLQYKWIKKIYNFCKKKEEDSDRPVNIIQIIRESVL